MSLAEIKDAIAELSSAELAELAIFMREHRSDEGAPALNVRSIPGHRVLTPAIPQSELADEMLGGR